MQTLPPITVSEGKPTIFVPLVIVVLVSMAKDFIEDRKRHNSDQKENCSEVTKLTGLGWQKTQWRYLHPGDMIKVHRNEYFPCDVLLMKHTSEAQIAFVETKNLDGESNLKLKKIPN